MVKITHTQKFHLCMTDIPPLTIKSKPNVGKYSIYGTYGIHIPGIPLDGNYTKIIETWALRSHRFRCRRHHGTHLCCCCGDGCGQHALHCRGDPGLLVLVLVGWLLLVVVSSRGYVILWNEGMVGWKIKSGFLLNHLWDWKMYFCFNSKML